MGKMYKPNRMVDTEYVGCLLESATKRSKSESQRSEPKQEDEVTYDVKIAQATSPVARSDQPFDNRLFGCLAILPAGRVIHEFQSIKKLLQALRNAVNAHRS